MGHVSEPRPLGEFVEVGSARVHLVDRCPEPGPQPGSPTVVLIHGSDGVLQEFSETVLDPLSERFRTIAVDRPGHGHSRLRPGEACDVPTNARVLREAVRARGAGRCVLVGHSYGGAVALRWTLDHPEDVAGLVLLSPAAYYRWPRAMPVVMAAPAAPVVGPALVRALLPRLGPWVLPVLSRRRSFRPRPVPPRFASFARAYYLRPEQFAALAEEYRRLRTDLHAMCRRYGEIEAPTRILVGSEDVVTVPERQAIPLAESIRGARVDVLPGLGHEMHWHAPEKVVEAIVEAASLVRPPTMASAPTSGQ